jgi:hypothetical protein
MKITSSGMKSWLGGIPTRSVTALGLFPTKLKPETTTPLIPTWTDLLELFRSMLEGDIKDRILIDPSQRCFNIRHRTAFPFRRLFVSTKKYMRLIPKNSQICDAISFMPGSDISFVLRRMENGHYQLTGVAYVHGLMYGELFRDESMEFESIVLV